MATVERYRDVLERAPDADTEDGKMILEVDKTE